MKAYIVGGIVGAAIGLTTAFMLTQSADENSGPPDFSPTDVLKLGVGVLGLMRGVAALSD